MKLALALLSTVIGLAYGCAEHGDEHDHAHLHKRLYPQTQLTPPTRPLVWGDLNIIHTTDSHGWLLGHQKTSFPEPNYSGDFGDFASFVTHMKEIALLKNVDLLLVDSGDLHDGTGLSDGYPLGGVDGHDTNEFIAQLPYDVMAIGNHELYVYADTYDMYTNFAPKLNGRYLSSNVNITVYDKNNNSVSVPVGNRYAKFKTLKGRSVTALGVLYDFTGNDVNTTVQKVENMVKEQWFAEAIQAEPDFFLLVGHMPVSNDKWPVVFDAVRAVHPYTPIVILGGHTHIRDCNQPDGRTMALESGRYMETVGWVSMNFDRPGSNGEGNLTFTRRYLDPNRVTYQYHTLTSNWTFDTIPGKAITQGLLDLAEKYDLSYQYGVAPHDFTISQSPYPSENSSLSLFIQQAAPVALTINNTRANIPNIMITNSGSQRFDIYSGPFTKNDQLTASPFTDAFLYIPNVTYSVASQVLPALNGQGAEEKRSLRSGLALGRIEEREREMYGRGDVERVYRRWLEEMNEYAEREVSKRAVVNGTLGYVTKDACPGIGDDTYHTALPYYSYPDFIGSNAPANVSDSDPIDLVFVDFIEDQLLEILNSVQSAKNYTTADVLSYTDVLANAVLGLYAEKAWNSTNKS